jgi:hypothetical protein
MEYDPWYNRNLAASKPPPPGPDRLTFAYKFWSVMMFVTIFGTFWAFVITMALMLG